MVSILKVQVSRGKSSKIWFVDKDKFQRLLDTSSSIAEVIEKIGLDPYNGNHKTLNQRIKEEKFNLTLLEQNRITKNKQIGIKKIIPLSNILTENSNYERSKLKKRLVEKGLLKYECCKCKNTGSWLGKPISLQLDHINGVNNDNRLENLRIMCPNCHSQTETYCGKHRKKIYTCLDCGIEIKKASTKCNKCAPKEVGKKSRKFEISKEELEKLIIKYPMTKVGNLLGVSDNSIRKRCKILEIDYKFLKASSRI